MNWEESESDGLIIYRVGMEAERQRGGNEERLTRKEEEEDGQSKDKEDCR